MHKVGQMSTLKEQDIIPPKSWIGTGTPDMPGGKVAMIELLGRNLQLTAVLTYNDNMAAGTLTALKDNGIAIPLHLSVIGFDNISIARHTDLQLTTVRYLTTPMAKLTTELALQGAADNIDPRVSHRFMSTLVCHHSIATRQNAAAVISLTNQAM